MIPGDWVALITLGPFLSLILIVGFICFAITGYSIIKEFWEHR